MEPAVVRQRLARLAAGPAPVDERSAAPIEPPGMATPRWLDPTGWDTGRPGADEDLAPAAGFTLADLAADDFAADDERQNDRAGHRLRPLPPAAVALVAVGVLATLIAAYLALRAPATTVPVVDFPASAGPTASRAPGPLGSPVPSSMATAAPARIVISVVGLVRRPGLVRLAPQSRVADALAAAGGAKPGADLLSLNLARPLRDGDQVVVGLADAPGRAGLRSTVIGIDGNSSGPPPVAGPGSPTDGGPGSGGKVDLNTATLEQLDALPGVGPVTAKAIVEWRSTHGAFAAVDQLAEVDGIGPARLQRLRALVTVAER